MHSCLKSTTVKACWRVAAARLPLEGRGGEAATRRRLMRGQAPSRQPVLSLSDHLNATEIGHHKKGDKRWCACFIAGRSRRRGTCCNHAR